MKKLYLLLSLIALISLFLICSGCEKKTLDIDKTLSGMSWSVLQYGLGSNNKVCAVSTLYYFIGEDTTINNKGYKKLYYYKDKEHKERFSEGFIRKENGKMYFLPPNNGSEYLMYDFELQQGAIFNGQYMDGGHYKYYVKQIDSVNVLGQSIKSIQFSLSADNSSIVDVWYDNIGSTQGLINTIHEPKPGGGGILICSSKNEEEIYRNSTFTKDYYDDNDIEEVDHIINNN